MPLDIALPTNYVALQAGHPGAHNTTNTAVNATAAAVDAINAINVKAAPYSATGNGTTDDTTAVQSAVAAAVSAGHGIVYFPSGTYSINTIYVNGDNISLVGAGLGLTILKRRAGTNVDGRVIAINSTGKFDTAAAGLYRSNITIADMTVDGNNANVTADVLSGTVQGAVYVGQGKNVNIRNLYILNPWYFGLQLRSCIGADVDNVTVDGMLGDWAQNSIHVEGDLYQGDPGFTANVRPSSGIRVRSCYVIRNRVVPNGIGICVQGSTDVAVSDCSIDMTGGASGRTAYGILFEGGGSGGALLLGRAYTCSGNEVRGCQYGIAAMDTNPDSVTTGILDGYTVSNNTVVDTVEGIIINGRNATISGNTVSADVCMLLGSNGKASIEGKYTVTGNTFLPQVGTALKVFKGTTGGGLNGVVINDNVIDGVAQTSNEGCGIHIAGVTTGFTINGNTILNTAAAAVFLEWVSASLLPANGRIALNEFINVVRFSGTVNYPYFYGIVSSGSKNVLVALNHFTNGASLSSNTVSANTTRGVLTVFGNTVGDGTTAVATDESNASARLAGTVTGSRGANAALASLLTGLASAQIVTDSTT